MMLTPTQRRTPTSYSPRATRPETMDAWTPLERFAFRFVFAYFVKFWAESLLDVGDRPRVLLNVLTEPPVRWLANNAFRPDSPVVIGSVRWALAQQFLGVAIAAIVATVWSLAARRLEYRRMRGWFFTVLRYWVACVMMVYGGFKIVESQFPPLALDQLARPFGSLSPMGLLWAFMGYSSFYASFTGLGEAAGAFLLFFRRTTTAGALILIAVLSNVVLLNYVFDIPVKYLSSVLLFATIVLAASDAKRLVAMLLLNQPTAERDVSFDFGKAWIYKVRRFLKPIIVVAATCGPMTASMFVRQSMVRTPSMFGVYDIDQYVRNGEVTAPLSTDQARWRQLTFGRGGSVSIRFMNDSVRLFRATVDSAARRISLRSKDQAGFAQDYAFEKLADGLALHGRYGADSIDVTLRKLDLERTFRLLRRH